MRSPIEIVRKNRLQQLIDERHSGRQSGLVEKIGINQGLLSAILRGVKPFGEKKARKIEEEYGLSAGWLDQQPSGSDQLMVMQPPGVYNVEPGPEILGQIPLISWVAAGNWCGVTDPYPVGDAEEWIPCPVKHGKRTYALRVKGESMHNPGGAPTFTDGDIIFVDPDRQHKHRSLVIVRRDDENEATFKRLLIDGENMMLEALNPSWPNRIIDVTGNATICGVVIAKIESFHF